MRPLAASAVLCLACVALAAAPAADPCAAAGVRLVDQAASAAAPVRAELDAYRASWRKACEAEGAAADLSGLLSEAEALVADVRIGRAVAALADAVPPDAPWPLPGIRRGADGLSVDVAAFSAFAPRGSAEDGRFFRGLARATAADGTPRWVGPPAPGGVPCLRLSETPWVEVAQGLDEMEGARSRIYARRAAALREQLLSDLRALARGGRACACVRGDPVPGLEALAGSHAKRGPPERRALGQAAADAAAAVRRGSVALSFLRDAPDAPPAGCAADPR